MFEVRSFTLKALAAKPQTGALLLLAGQRADGLLKMALPAGPWPGCLGKDAFRIGTS
jgi:hypothetical protein